MSILKLSDFNYNLPENLIAQKPTKPRDHCRLLILNRKTGDIRHEKFFEIVRHGGLQKGDVLVFNDSKVIPARILGNKAKPRTEVVTSGAWETGGKVEILLIKKISPDTWEAMLKNFKTKEFGKKILITSSLRVRQLAEKQFFIAVPIKNIGEGLWQIKFNFKGTTLDKAIHKHGQTPLPPYIKKMAKLADYQTIYAKKEGSIAAPTAGLHFTKNLLNKLKRKGVKLETVTLHVGLGTFAPIRGDNIEKHKMHAEIAEISAKTAKAINKAKKEGRRVIAVGTTSARALEAFAHSTHNPSVPRQNGSPPGQFGRTGVVGLAARADLQQPTNNKNQKFKIKSGTKNVDIFIKPGYDFKIVDGIITNFHLPQTTLIILVSAFASTDKILCAYNEAINKKYKFFSFGDAMLII